MIEDGGQFVRLLLLVFFLSLVVFPRLFREYEVPCSFKLSDLPPSTFLSEDLFSSDHSHEIRQLLTHPELKPWLPRVEKFLINRNCFVSEEILFFQFPTGKKIPVASMPVCSAVFVGNFLGLVFLTSTTLNFRFANSFTLLLSGREVLHQHLEIFSQISHHVSDPFVRQSRLNWLAEAESFQTIFARMADSFWLLVGSLNLEHNAAGVALPHDKKIQKFNFYEWEIVRNFRFTFERISVRTEFVVEDSLREFRRNPELLKRNFQVHFVSGNGIDQGGPRQQWMALMGRELFAERRGLFVSGELGLRFAEEPWKNYPHEILTQIYAFAGKFLALAVAEKFPIGKKIPCALLVLLSAALTTQTDVVRCGERWTQEILEMSADIFGSLEFEWTYVLEGVGSFDLRTGRRGAGEGVRWEDRKLFVERRIMREQVGLHDEMIGKFVGGFREMWGDRQFEVRQLGEAILGEDGEKVPLLKWKAVTEYEVGNEVSGNFRYHPHAVWFWSVVDELNDKERKSLLLHLTGFHTLRFDDRERRYFRLVLEAEGELVVSTCFKYLRLPKPITRPQIKLWVDFVLENPLEFFEH